METGGRLHAAGRDPHPLKPSLVEWKPVAMARDAAREFLLETFLGGMETVVFHGACVLQFGP